MATLPVKLSKEKWAALQPMASAVTDLVLDAQHEHEVADIIHAALTQVYRDGMNAGWYDCESANGGW